MDGRQGWTTQGGVWRRGGRSANKPSNGLNFPEQRACLVPALGRVQRRGVHSIEGARAHCLEYARRIAIHVGGDHDNRTRSLGHDSPGGLHPVEPRQDNIHQDQVRAIPGAEFDRLRPVLSDPGDLVGALADDGPAQCFDREDHVVDDRDSHASGGPIRSTTAWRRVSPWKLPLVK